MARVKLGMGIKGMIRVAMVVVWEHKFYSYWN